MEIEVSAFAGFNRAADNNRQVICEQLARLFNEPATILEIGSGSGQHAVHFAQSLQHLTWQPTDRGDYFNLLQTNLTPPPLENILSPLYLDVSDFPALAAHDGAFLANVLHIMPEALIAPLMAGVAGVLKPGGRLVCYGPFKYGGEFTTESNASFDHWLKQRDPLSGVRDIEIVRQQAGEAGLRLIEDNPMPANNQLLVFDLVV